MYFETKRSINSNYIYTQDDENLCFVSHVHNSYFQAMKKNRISNRSPVSFYIFIATD